MAQGLRPGDSVQVLAAYTEGARRGRAVVLLPSAEVVQVLQDPAGLAGTGQERGVQLRMPSDRAPIVVAAVATARIFVVKTPGLASDSAVTDRSGAPPARSEPDPSGSEPGVSSPTRLDPAGSDPSASEPGVPDSTGPSPAQPEPTSPSPGEAVGT